MTDRTQHSRCWQQRTMRLVLERGHLWDEAIARFEAGERGEEAGEALEQIAARLNIT